MRVVYIRVSQELLHIYFLEAALLSQSRRINASNQAITATITPRLSKKQVVPDTQNDIKED